jgi:hypothetical protein
MELIAFDAGCYKIIVAKQVIPGTPEASKRFDSLSNNSKVNEIGEILLWLGRGCFH